MQFQRGIQVKRKAGFKGRPWFVVNPGFSHFIRPHRRAESSPLPSGNRRHSAAGEECEDDQGHGGNHDGCPARSNGETKTIAKHWLNNTLQVGADPPNEKHTRRGDADEIEKIPQTRKRHRSPQSSDLPLKLFCQRRFQPGLCHGVTRRFDLESLHYFRGERGRQCHGCKTFLQDGIDAAVRLQQLTTFWRPTQTSVHLYTCGLVEASFDIVLQQVFKRCQIHFGKYPKVEFVFERRSSATVCARER